MTQHATLRAGDCRCGCRRGVQYTPQLTEEDWGKLEVTLQRHIDPQSREKIQRAVLRKHLKQQPAS